MDAKSVIGKIGTVIIVLIIFILILYLAYFVTKKVGRRLSVRAVGNKNIKILETISIGQHNAVMIIETAGKTLLVGVTQNQISLISELDSDKLFKEDESSNVQTMDFSSALKKVLDEKFGKKIDKPKEKHDDNGNQQ